MHRSIKVQIVSRDIPVENTGGNATYILDFMHYLRQAGCEIEYILLNSLSNGREPWYILPPMLASLAKVSVKDNFQVGRVLIQFNLLPIWLTKLLLRQAYNLLLPKTLKDIYRSARDKRRQISDNVATPKAWDDLATPEELAFVNSQVVRFQPNVVVVNYAWLSNVFDGFISNESVLKVILTHDILHKRVANFRKMGIAPDISEWHFEKEAAQLCKAQVLLAIQKDEAETFRNMAPGSEVICMPVSFVYHTHNTKQVHGRCLFVGSCSSHNVHSLQWFLESVWPIVLQTDPYCHLHVYGSVCDHIQGNFANVHLRGGVEDLKPEYGAAQVCLVPLLMGSGLKIKLVEALSHGRACVSTSIGVQGLRDIVGSAVLVADTAEEFAAAIHTLLNNPEKRQWMEAQAYKYVKEKLSPKAVYQPFIDRVEQHLQQVSNRL